MIESFIHEEYVNKRREQRRQHHQQQQQHQHQQRHRHRRQTMRALQIDKIEKVNLPPAATTAAAGQQSPRDQHQAAAAVSWSPVGSPTADQASFRDHLFDYLKPY